MRSLLVLAWIAGSLDAQAPRDPIPLNPTPPSNAGQTAIASADDLTAVCWSDAGSDEVYVATSDGRGLAWSGPVRVDNDAGSKKTNLDSVQVSGDAVYVVYESASALYFVRSTDRGATFSAPVPLDVGPGSTNDWAVAMTSVGGNDHLHVASATSVTDEDLYVASSTDSGASFAAALFIPGNGGDVDEVDIAAFENVVHVVWDDNQFGADSVLYQRSIDAGATYLAAPVGLGDAPGTEDSQAPLRIAVSGNTVAVLWTEEPAGSGNEIMQANVSTNAGATWSGAKQVGATPGASDADEGDVAIDGSGAVVCVFEDNRTGTDEAYAAISTDGGLNWLPDVQLSSIGAEKPRLAAGARGLVATWESTTVFPREARSRFTGNGGISWEPVLTLSDPAFGSVDFVTAAFNDRYRNCVQAWTSLNGSNLDVFAGGFRPQTLTPVSWVVGPTSAGFTLERFDPAFPLGGVLMSSGPGVLPLPFGDGRDVGLALDALFLTSVNLFGSALGAAIDGSGSGATPSFGVNVPPGFSVLAVGYQIGIGPGGVGFGDLSDAVVIAP